MRVVPDQKLKGNAPAKDESAAPPPTSDPPAATQEGAKPIEVAVEITGSSMSHPPFFFGIMTLPIDIKASGLPAKVGFFSGVFYVRVKGGQVPQRTKTARYNKEDEFVASWSDTVKLCVLNSGCVPITDALTCMVV